MAGAALLAEAVPPPARRASLRTLHDPSSGEALDDALVLWFPGPNSYTGEDMFEFHCHGGIATIDAVRTALTELPGCRQAEPGEFTRRAFSNGRMDLPDIEGLADLIAAETDAQRRLALNQARGSGNDAYRAWTERLIRIAAALEAAVDFPEDDLPDSILTRNEIEMQRMIDEWEQHIELGRLSSQIRDGVRIAIVGAPNAGKSSLLNRLAGREAAIVSETAGTTRDVIEVRLALAGYPVTLSDTAGLREGLDLIEQEGIRRTRVVAEAADMILWLAEDVGVFKGDPPTAGMRADNKALLQVLTKGDNRVAPTGWHDPGSGRLVISSVTGDGLDVLVGELEDRIFERLSVASLAVATRQRHQEGLARARAALVSARGQGDLGLAGEDVRVALTEIGRITGRVDVEQVLDALFGEFCIGK